MTTPISQQSGPSTVPTRPVDSRAEGDSPAQSPQPPSPLRVCYDISILGYAHVYGSTGRTGVHRVVEELAGQLAASPECDLCFSAIDCRPEVGRYLAETARWSGYGLPPVRGSAPLRGALATINTAVNSANPARALPARAARKAAMLLYRHSVHADYPSYPVGDMDGVDVFHSPSAGLPAGLRRRRSPACFQTVYDLIPVLFDDVVVGHQQEHIAATLRALKEQSWALAISQSTKNDLCSYTGMDPARVFVTPLAADRAKFYPNRDSACLENMRARLGIPGGPYLLSVCTLEPRKNLDFLLRCFARIAHEPGMKDYSLVLAGNAGWKDEKIYTTLAELSALKSRVKVTGYVADQDLAALYSGATAFVYPSLYEGFGLPPLEAMQCGTPVLVSNTSSLPEVVGEAGLLADPRDEAAFCQGMLDLCLKSSLHATLAARALSRAAAFRWERCTLQTMQAYAQAVASS